MMSDLLKEEPAGGWLVTYADLMTLLLTFFVLLFSISSMNLEKFKRALAAIQVSLGEKHPPVHLLDIIEDKAHPMNLVKADGESETKPAGQNIALENLIGLKSRDLYRDVQHLIHKQKASDHIIVSMEGSKVIIRVTGQVLFESGIAILNPRASPILDDICQIIKQYPEYRLRIEGHSDDIPISTPQFPSNWELSAVRATTVLRYLIDRGISPRRLTATGYGSLLPLVPNTTEANRARNRRVEFVLEKED
ncbi:MAG: OmpA family protein [Deltaproteobacteria bacterium]|nr:OmpA family protein [Deltaproteobacteria bacterium]